ncbi:MAG: NAD(P)-dependent oxidoreductase [Acutalibacteraceae bacterium]|nr:NAD(P)-dependent oxidoreductase [Acutalibacteraceae bacterium]
MKLLLTGAFNYSEQQINCLKEIGYDVTFIQDERKELDVDCSVFDAVVCNGLFLYTSVEKFKNLKYIQATSVGLDRLPLEHINQNNIMLKTARGVYSIPMAEWCVSRILDVYKHSEFFFENQKNKKWEKHRGLTELNGKTAVVVGAGDIGTETAKRLYAFGVEVIAVDIVKPVASCYSSYYDIADIKEALAKADIVIITLPLTESTRNLFNEQTLGFMRSNAILVNMARGGIIDEKALVNALQNDKLGGAILDVFEKEPLEENNNLWYVKNLLITPHNSFVSDRNNERLFNVIYSNLKDFAKQA